MNGTWVIALSLLTALMLNIIPLPDWAAFWRPDWAAMVLIYWCAALPHRVGIAAGWTTGLLQDILTDTLLGQHALGFSLIAYLAVGQHRRMGLFTLWQQSALVAGLILCVQLWHIILRSLTDQSAGGVSALFPVLSSALLWFWVCIILRDIQQKLKVF